MVDLRKEPGTSIKRAFIRSENHIRSGKHHEFGPTYPQPSEHCAESTYHARANDVKNINDIEYKGEREGGRMSRKPKAKVIGRHRVRYYSTIIAILACETRSKIEREPSRDTERERGTKTGNLSGARALNVAPKRTT
jgi:hypothetical protein